MTFHGFDGIRSTQPTVLLTQQAPVRRGPRASATSLVTVSLTESETDAFLPNGVCVSPVHISMTFHGFDGIRSTQPTVLLTQQAPVRRGPRASANSLVTVSLAESEISR